MGGSAHGGRVANDGPTEPHWLVSHSWGVKRVQGGKTEGGVSVSIAEV